MALLKCKHARQTTRLSTSVLNVGSAETEIVLCTLGETLGVFKDNK